MVPDPSSSKNFIMTSTNATLTSVPALQHITEKLTGSNFSIWRAFVVSVLKGAQPSDFLEGKVVAPEETLASDDKKVKMPNLSSPFSSSSSSKCSTSCFHHCPKRCLSMLQCMLL
jgi:hypothetical protein